MIGIEMFGILCCCYCKGNSDRTTQPMKQSNGDFTNSIYM